MIRRFLLPAVALLCLWDGTANAEVTPFTPQGFRFQIAATVPGDTNTVFDQLTGDIKPWWDHTYSGDPKVMVIEPFAGGEFREEFKEGQDGVRHAVVTWADRGRGFRMEGPLGLAGRGFMMVSTITLAAQAGDSTGITVDVAMMGEVDADLAGIVERVWNHFIIERFKPYVEGRLEE